MEFIILKNAKQKKAHVKSSTTFPFQILISKQIVESCETTDWQGAQIFSDSFHTNGAHREWEYWADSLNIN